MFQNGDLSFSVKLHKRLKDSIHMQLSRFFFKYKYSSQNCLIVGKCYKGKLYLLNMSSHRNVFCFYDDACTKTVDYIEDLT